MAGIAQILPVVTSLLGAFGGGGPSAPSPAPAPPPPAPAPLPPPPEVSSAPEASSEPVIDSEAARIRAQKRRQANQDQSLTSLNTEESSSASLTKSILGDS